MKMTQHFYSSDCGPHLIMVNEPEPKSRFRYESEGGSHGGLTGRAGKKTYPTVKLVNYNGLPTDIFIRVNLYTENKTEHVLKFKKKKSSENQNYIDENLSENYSAEFKNLTILSKKKEEIYQALMDRRISNLGRNLSRFAKDKFERENCEVVKKEAREILNSVILRFDAFECCRPNVQICPPLYSGPICNQKASSKGDLKIHRMSKASGCWRGDEDMILLCDKVQKETIKIVFYENDVEDGWREYASFNKSDVHYQVAIPFKTPKYKENIEKTVAVALERQGELSEPRYFTYIPEDCPARKRKKCVPDLISSPMDISSPGSSSAGNNSMSDDSSQEAMQALERPMQNMCKEPDTENNFDPSENPSSVLNPSQLNEMAIQNFFNILIEDPLFMTFDGDFPEIGNGTGDDQMINQSDLDELSLFPTDFLQVDIGIPFAQMNLTEIKHPKSVRGLLEGQMGSAEIEYPISASGISKDRVEFQMGLANIEYPKSVCRMPEGQMGSAEIGYPISPCGTSKDRVEFQVGLTDTEHPKSVRRMPVGQMDPGEIKFPKFVPGMIVGEGPSIIEHPKSACDSPKPIYQKESRSGKTPENQKKKLEKYLHLISKRDHLGNTLLHLAVLHGKNIGVILYMSQMAKSDIINVQNYNKQTALHIAVEKNADVVKILLKNGANPSIKNADGNNCYHIACQKNSDTSLRSLLGSSKFTRGVNEFNYEGLTPLHIAIKEKSLACFDILVAFRKADLGVVERKCGRSLLHYAVEFHPSAVVPILEKEVIDVNVQDFEGNTPLHIACEAEDCNTVKQLLLAEADPLVRNSKPSFLDSDEEGSGDETPANLTKGSDDETETPVGQTPADLTTNSQILELLQQASKKNRSGCDDSTDNAGSEALLENLCNLLDSEMRWKTVATYILDEMYLDSLQCSPSPTRALLQYMKKNFGEGYIERFKAVLEMVDFNDAVQMITESNKPLIVL